VLIEWRRVRHGNGNGGLNEDTGRTLMRLFLVAARGNRAARGH